MPDPRNPQTLDETDLMDGTIGSVAVDSVGEPTVILWITDEATTAVHQMNGTLDTDAVASLGMLQLLRDAVQAASRVRVRYTTDTGGAKWFHLVRIL
jgi:hypothetical protein